MNEVNVILNHINTPFTNISIISDRLSDATELLYKLKYNIQKSYIKTNNKTHIRLINETNIKCYRLNENCLKGVTTKILILYNVKPSDEFEKFKVNFIPVANSITDFKIMIL